MITNAYIDVKSLAIHLNVSKDTVYNWVYTEKIPFKRINGVIRFDPQEIDNWIKEQNK
jgi:excisionase family DNA binding protein